MPRARQTDVLLLLFGLALLSCSGEEPPAPVEPDLAVAWDRAARRTADLHPQEIVVERSETIWPRVMRQMDQQTFAAPVWLSGPGDQPLQHSLNASRSRCTCQLFEDNVALGPKQNDYQMLHRTAGGAWSHWMARKLVFSTSDGTDPRTNKRTYRLVRKQVVRVERANVTLTPSQPVLVSLDLDDDKELFRVVLSGRHCSVPMVVLMKAPQAPELWSMKHTVAGLKARSRSSEELAIALHNLIVDQRYHYYPPTPQHPVRLRDPAVMLNIYGFGFCHEAAGALVNLLRIAGLPARMRGINGHVVAEAWYKDSWHMLDPDGNALVRGATGSLLSVQQLMADPDLIRGGIIRRSGVSSSTPMDKVINRFKDVAATEHANGSDPTSFLAPEPTMWVAPVVRPGESVTFDYTDPRGRVCKQYCLEPFPPLVGTGSMRRELAVTIHDQTEIAVSSRYAILGAVLDARLEGVTNANGLTAKVLMPQRPSCDPEMTLCDGTLHMDLTRCLSRAPRELWQYSLELSVAENQPAIRLQGTLSTVFQFAPAAHSFALPGTGEILIAAVPLDAEAPGDDHDAIGVTLEWTTRRAPEP